MRKMCYRQNIPQSQQKTKVENLFLKSKIQGLEISFLAVFDRNFIEIFDDKKKFVKKFFFSVITKNLNWEILTKNLVTFRRWDWVKYEKS